jgi:hypothetical protein
MTGGTNIAVGLRLLGSFMLYGFFLIYLRDFAPGKEQWIADCAVGKHFESRLAHGHGNLFALIITAVGLVLIRLPVQQSSARWIAGLALAGTLSPLGILSEVVHGVPPLLVNVGGISMVAAVAWLGMFGWRLDLTQGGRP